MNMSKLIKQAQEMQKKMTQVQEGLKSLEISANVGGGAITIKGNCDYEVNSIEISPDLLEDEEMLKDLLISAINEYNDQVKKRSDEEMKAVTGGMNIPGL